jgi:hypothetical protein
MVLTMSRPARPDPLVLGAAALLAATVNLHAQSLGDLCPGADPEKSAAVVGVVQDVDSGMILPGARVEARWVQADAAMQVEAPVGVDGTFTLCGLPREVELSVHAWFADHRGHGVVLTMLEPVARQDLGVELSAAGEAIPVYWSRDEVPCAFERVATVRADVSTVDFRAAASEELARLGQRHEADAVLVDQTRLPFVVQRGDRPSNAPATRSVEGIAIRFTEEGCLTKDRS